MAKNSDSFFSAFTGYKPSGPFKNAGSKSTKSYTKKNDAWGGSTYSGGRGGPLGLGHGHNSAGHKKGPRYPVSDFLGNTAIRGSKGGFKNRNQTPRW